MAPCFGKLVGKQGLRVSPQGLRLAVDNTTDLPSLSVVAELKLPKDGVVRRVFPCGKVRRRCLVMFGQTFITLPTTKT